MSANKRNDQKVRSQKANRNASAERIKNVLRIMEFDLKHFLQFATNHNNNNNNDSRWERWCHCVSLYMHACSVCVLCFIVIISFSFSFSIFIAWFGYCVTITYPIVNYFLFRFDLVHCLFSIVISLKTPTMPPWNAKLMHFTFITAFFSCNGCELLLH